MQNLATTTLKGEGLPNLGDDFGCGYEICTCERVLWIDNDCPETLSHLFYVCSRLRSKYDLFGRNDLVRYLFNLRSPFRRCLVLGAAPMTVFVVCM